jgi:hypothetical protein
VPPCKREARKIALSPTISRDARVEERAHMRQRAPAHEWRSLARDREIVRRDRVRGFVGS